MRKISILGTDVEAVMSIEGEPANDTLQHVSEILRRRVEYALTMEMDRLFATAMRVIDAEHPADFYVRPAAALEHVFVAFASGWNKFLEAYFGKVPEVLVAHKADAMHLFDQWKVAPGDEVLGYHFPLPMSEMMEEMRQALMDEVLDERAHKIKLPPIWKELLLNVFTQGWNACRQSMGSKG